MSDQQPDWLMAPPSMGEWGQRWDQWMQELVGRINTNSPTPAPDPPFHSVAFRSQNTLATAGAPNHVLGALGYTGSYPITRSQLDGILDDWVSSTGGTTRNVTSSGTWTTAMNNAVPGDLVRVTTGFDPAPGVNARGALYGISGANLTASPSDLGGTAGLPIIVTCADGVYLDDNDTSSNEAILDLQNCRHVWAVGFNVRDGQFGIRAQNWGGTASNPAYIAYCDVDNIGDAGIAAQGWWQAIADSGGTPPAGTGNEWGYSEYFVIEENTIDGVGVRTGVAPGEGIYLGYGAGGSHKSYAQYAWVRGNSVTDYTSDGIDVKPGAWNIFITDNDIFIGHANSGAAMQIYYVDSSTTDRDGTLFDRDPEIYIEGNRVWDLDTTNVDAGSVHYMLQFSVSGIRCANNVFWAWPQTGTHPAVRARTEAGANDTEAIAEWRTDPTWFVNNTFWCDDTFQSAGYGAGPTAFPSTITDTFDLRNNLCDQASPADGEVDAAATDFIATVPAIGVAGDAEWSTYGKGSAFDLATPSIHSGTGESVSDLSFYIAADIAGRTIPNPPAPGAFQPFS